MRWLTLGCFGLLLSCRPAAFQQEKLNDGSIKVTCELSMDDCVRRAQDLCTNQRYRIVEGTSETRLRDAPPYESAYHTSRLHLRCTEDGANESMSTDEPAAETSKSAPAGCTAGETRTCVGSGACTGGQACLPGGRGFGPCDCGPGGSQPPPAPPTAPEAAPASTPVEAVTPPAISPPAQPNSAPN